MTEHERPPLTAFDTTVHTHAATRLTGEQARQAALVTCDRTGSAADAAPVLELLGLIPATTAPVRRWDSAGIVHGTRSAVEWHQNHADPRMRALCQRCRDYLEVQERSAKRRGANLRVVDGG
jgi:hypothetical protein